MTRIRAIPHNSVSPKITRVRVSQVVSVELDLRVCLLDHRAVRRRDAIVRKERRSHVHEVGPDAT